MSIHPRLFVFVVGFSAACRTAPSMSPPTEPPASATRVFAGDVYPLHEPRPAPTYRYERWESRDGAQRISTHVTFVPGESHPIMVLEGLHDSAFALHEMRVRDDTRGIVGGVRIVGDRVRFERTRRGRTRTHDERRAEDLLAAPNLFGWIRAHWGELASGASRTIRFAVVENLRSYPFDLRVTGRDATEGTTTVTLTATRRLIRMVVPPMQIVFDDATGRVRSYRGRVPPLAPDGRAMDADVRYRHFVQPR